MKRITMLFAAFAVALSTIPLSAVPAAADQNASYDPAVTLSTAEAKLADLNNQVEQASGRLDLLNRKLDEDAAREAQMSKEAAGLARLQYESPVISLGAVFGARSLGDLLGEIAQARVIDAKQRALLTKLRQMRKDDQAARDQAQVELNKVKSARDEAAKMADDAKAANDAAIAARAAAIAAMNAPAPAPARSAWSGAAAASQPVTWSGGGSWPNHFSYGYCTWYVANKRYVPWFGNAIEWYPNARAYGYAEGGSPRPGAIMVTAESGYGHVAYVERVNPDGSWVVSEMNFAGWNVVSSRTVRYGQTSLIGFIY